MNTPQEQTITLIWVTDPYIPEITPINSEIMKILSSDQVSVISSVRENLEQSIFKYTYTLGLPQNQYDREIITQVQNMIGKISYSPVTLSLLIDNTKTEKLLKPEIITGIESIVSSLTKRVLNTRVGLVLRTQYQINDGIIIEYSPMLSIGRAIYRSRDYINKLVAIADLNNYIGYKVLSDSTLTPYVMSTINNQFRPEHNDIRFNHGVFLIKVGDDYNRYSSRVRNMIDSLNMNSYFTFPDDLSVIPDGNDYLLAMEIAEMFKIEMIFQSDLYANILVFKNHLDFSMSPQNWMNESINKIKRGLLPSFIINTDISSDYLYALLNDNITIKSRLQLGAIRAYLKTIVENKILTPFIYLVKVSDDYSIEVNVTNQKDILTFRSNLSVMLEGSDQWNVIPSNDITDAIVKRWYLQIRFPRIKTFIHYTNNLYVVIAMSYDKSQIAFPSDLSDYKKSLMDTLAVLPQGDIYDPLRSDEDVISSLYALFSNEYFSDDIKQVDLLLPSFIDKDQVFKWGLYGLYQLGPLKGLIDYIPVRKIMTPSVGSLVVNSNDDESIFTFDVSIGEKQVNESRHRLISIIDSSHRIKDLQTVTDAFNNLWSSGYLLGYWGTAYMNSFGFSNAPFNVDASLLKINDSQQSQDEAIDSLITLSDSLRENNYQQQGNDLIP